MEAPLWGTSHGGTSHGGTSHGGTSHRARNAWHFSWALLMAAHAPPETLELIAESTDDDDPQQKIEVPTLFA